MLHDVCLQVCMFQAVDYCHCVIEWFFLGLTTTTLDEMSVAAPCLILSAIMP